MMPQNPQKELYPLHILFSKLYSKVINQLPAGHNPTGCDTVAKVETKKLLRMLNSFDPLITAFGDDMLQLVEQLLINVVTSIYLVALSTN